MTAWITFILGLLAGAIFGLWLGGGRSLHRRPLRRPRRPQPPPSSVEHFLDLVRRAHHASMVCLCGRGTEPVVTKGSATVEPEIGERALSLARLALSDGREHVARGDHAVVAVGDLHLGAAVVLDEGDPAPDRVQGVAAELRRLLGEFRVDLGERLTTRAAGPEPLSDLPPRLDTLAAIGSGLCDRARIITGRPTAVVARDPETQDASVIAVSHNADRRLIGIAVAPDSVVGRVCMGAGAVAAGSGEDLFGRVPENRRQKAAEGTAYPLRDGRDGVGALVVFGPKEELDVAALERLMWLVVDTGPRFAAACAVRAAEERTNRDRLTGLPNRTTLEGAMASAPDGPCAVLRVDVDHFKRIADEHGQAAGDAVLRHLARILRGVVRDVDLTARIEGGEFAMWLPDTEVAAARNIAERIRHAVQEATCRWAGTQISLTCSIGVASRPETSLQISDLLSGAEAAVARARDAGRNRVELASGVTESPG